MTKRMNQDTVASTIASAIIRTNQNMTSIDTINREEVTEALRNSEARLWLHHTRRQSTIEGAWIIGFENAFDQIMFIQYGMKAFEMFLPQ